MCSDNWGAYVYLYLLIQATKSRPPGLQVFYRKSARFVLHRVLLGHGLWSTSFQIVVLLIFLNYI
jgi:hypothetical protein